MALKARYVGITLYYETCATVELTIAAFSSRCRHLWTWQIKLKTVLPQDHRLACAFEVCCVVSCRVVLLYGFVSF